MNLATLRAAIDGLVDDGNSCRFYKRWQVMSAMTKKELVEILAELHALQYPGLTLGGKQKIVRTPKLDIARYIDFKLNRLDAN